MVKKPHKTKDLKLSISRGRFIIILSALVIGILFIAVIIPTLLLPRPAQGQWNSEVGDKYLFIYEYYNTVAEAFTVKNIGYVNIIETNNRPEQLNGINATGDLYQWYSAGGHFDSWHEPLIHEITPIRIPKIPIDIQNVPYPWDLFVPLGYSNSEEMEELLNESLTTYIASDIDLLLLNYSLEFVEVQYSAITETHNGMIYLDPDIFIYIVSKTYNTVKYSLEFFFNNTDSEYMFHIAIQYIIERDTGMPLAQGSIFSVYNSDLSFEYAETWVWRTIATSVVLTEAINI